MVRLEAAKRIKNPKIFRSVLELESLRTRYKFNVSAVISNRKGNQNLGKVRRLKTQRKPYPS